MEKLQYATKLQRGLCFLIDALIVCGFGFLIGYLSIYATGFNDYYQNAYNAGIELVFTDSANELAVACVLAVLYRILILAGSFLFVMIIYLIILPLTVKFQTLGRLITKTKLVSRKNTKPSLGQLIVREIVGEYLIYVLLSIILRFMNMFFYISVGYCFLQDISIPDLISRTKIVSLKKSNQEAKFSAEEYQYSDDYDWEVDNDTSQEVKKEDENATSEK